MALQDFINANSGHALDYDGYYGAQCVDLVNFWARTLGSGPFSGPTALNLVAPAGWRWVANSPSGVPPEGAVVKYNFAPAGHVSIARAGGNTNSFPSFDQNWNGHHYCEPVTHDYAHVLGWWVKDNPTPNPAPVATAYPQRNVPINVAIVNVRSLPNTSAPIVGSLHQGYATITGEAQGSSGTVGSHTSSTWYRTLNGNWFNAAATQ